METKMNDYKAWADEVIGKIREKMDWVSEKNQDKIPYTTDEKGSYDDLSGYSEKNGGDLDWWTNGFWGGLMWLMYQDTKQEKYARIARASEEKLKQCFGNYYGLHHDVGFM